MITWHKLFIGYIVFVTTEPVLKCNSHNLIFNQTVRYLWSQQPVIEKPIQSRHYLLILGLPWRYRREDKPVPIWLIYDIKMNDMEWIIWNEWFTGFYITKCKMVETTKTHPIPFLRIARLWRSGHVYGN